MKYPVGPDELYDQAWLLGEFDSADPLGFTKTPDFGIFQLYHRDGGEAPVSLSSRLEQAKHDAHMSNALRNFLIEKVGPGEARVGLVGIMGGHRMTRTQHAYQQVARLCRELTRAGYMIVSGGGPGAMEAAHVGAWFANADANAFEEALHDLKAEPGPLKLYSILDSKGELKSDTVTLAELKKAHRWLALAIQVRDSLKVEPGRSLAIPTWLYGAEPTMPFASHYAKYFHNSIREEALVREAWCGIVYAWGGGGTVREIFQDVEQNYYAADPSAFTPMIFFDPNNYWGRSATYNPDGSVETPGIDVQALLPEIFRYAHASKDATQIETILDKIIFSTDFDLIRTVLDRQRTPSEHRVDMLLAGRGPEMLSIKMLR